MTRFLFTLLMAVLCAATPAWANDRPETMVFAVGIERYDNPKLDKLEFAADGARKVFDAFKRISRLNEAKSRQLLADDDSAEGKDDWAQTAYDFDREFHSFVRKISDNSNVVIYLSGHGMHSRTGKVLYIPSNYDLEEQYPVIKIEDLYETIADHVAGENLSGVHVTMLLDICGAGNAEDIARAGLTPQNVNDNQDLIDSARKLQEELQFGKFGFSLIPATPRDRNAYEDSGRGGSQFALALEPLLLGAAADKRGQITVGELHAQLSDSLGNGLLPGKIVKDHVVGFVGEEEGRAHLSLGTALTGALAVVEESNPTSDQADLATLLADLADIQFREVKGRNPDLYPRSLFRRGQLLAARGAKLPGGFEALTAESRLTKAERAAVSNTSRITSSIAAFRAAAMASEDSSAIVFYSSISREQQYIITNDMTKQKRAEIYTDIIESTSNLQDREQMLPEILSEIIELEIYLKLMPKLYEHISIIYIPHASEIESEIEHIIKNHNESAQIVLHFTGNVGLRIKPGSQISSTSQCTNNPKACFVTHFTPEAIKRLRAEFVGDALIFYDASFGGFFDVKPDPRTIIVRSSSGYDQFTFTAPTPLKYWHERFPTPPFEVISLELIEFASIVVKKEPSSPCRLHLLKGLFDPESKIDLPNTARLCAKDLETQNSAYFGHFSSAIPDIRVHTGLDAVMFDTLSNLPATILNDCLHEAHETCAARFGGLDVEALFAQGREAAARDIARDHDRAGEAYGTLARDLRSAINAAAPEPPAAKDAAEALRMIADMAGRAAARSLGKARQSRIVLLPVAVGEYASPLVPDLPHARADVESYRDIFGGDVEILDTLLPKTSEDLRKALRELRQGLSELDLLILVYSGRGLSHDGEMFLSTSDVDFTPGLEANGSLDMNCTAEGPNCWSTEHLLSLNEVARIVDGVSFFGIYDAQFTPPARDPGAPPRADAHLDKHLDAARQPLARSANGGGVAPESFGSFLDGPKRQVHLWIEGRLTQSARTRHPCLTDVPDIPNTASPLSAALLVARANGEAVMYRDLIEVMAAHPCLDAVPGGALRLQGVAHVPIGARGEGADEIGVFYGVAARRMATLAAAEGFAEDVVQRFPKPYNLLSKAALYYAHLRQYTDDPSMAWRETERKTVLWQLRNTINKLRRLGLSPGRAAAMLDEIEAQAHLLDGKPEEARTVLLESKSLSERGLAQILMRATEEFLRAQPLKLFKQVETRLRAADADETAIERLRLRLDEERQRQGAFLHVTKPVR